MPSLNTLPSGSRPASGYFVTSLAIGRESPLETLEIVVQLIGSTRTEAGLEVHCWLDTDQYEKGRKVTDAEMQDVLIKPNTFHGEWNYEIHPHQHRKYR
jgi:hypothetical protein